MRLKLDRKDEIGQLAYAMDGFSENLQVSVVGTMKKIAAGDLSTDVKAADGQDEIAPAMIQMTTALRAMVAEAQGMVQAAVNGKLATRADASKYQGDYRKIVQGVNECLDAVIGPLNVAAGYVDRISKGDIPPKISDKYNGDFNTIKNNLNVCVDAVNALVADAGVLNKAAVDGKLATRADATKHQGDFRKIVQGVNECLDAVIGPLNVAAGYVDRISKGDIPPKITDKYNGDFNEIKNNLNTCVDAVNALVADAVVLNKAAIDGKLATRADATKHQGDFRKIVQGVNECLDAVIGPLNVAAGYVDRISKGDIPPKISDKYNGDFNEIKNNLNVCVDAVNALVADAVVLNKAAVEGKLATRADATKHQGDFRKIVQGVNECLDAVIGPLNVAAGYVDRISKGDVPPKITDNYNGDFNEIKNNLNTCVDAVNALVGDAGMLSKAAADGKLATRADASKHQGDFRKIVQGVNDTLDGVINPINEVQRIMGAIEQGDLTAIYEVAAEADAFEDWPWLLLFRELDLAFPGSRFVLTTRAPDRWIRSYLNMLRHPGFISDELTHVRRVLYGLPFPDVTAEQLIDRYCRHNDTVTDYFRGRPHDLLVVDWEAGHGWPELCRFLGRDVPDQPFPKENVGTYEPPPAS
jgi:methyl-accepting chemotaxis protein